MILSDSDFRALIKGLQLTVVELMVAIAAAILAFVLLDPGGSNSDTEPVPVALLNAVGGDTRVHLQAHLPSESGTSGIKWQYQQKPAGGIFGPWKALPPGGVVESLANGWAYSFRVRAVRGPKDETVAALPSREASVVLAHVWPRHFDPEWLLKADVAARVCPDGDPAISEPIVFRPGRADLEGSRTDGIRRTLRVFLQEARRRPSVKIHLVGLASPDGDRSYNATLSGRRVEAVQRLISSFGDEEGAARPEVHYWGEEHLTNGIARSRSVRLVSCGSSS